MAAIRRILVAIKNPAARTFPAVTKAAQIATALGSRIELFHDMTATLYTGFPDGMMSDARAFEREHRVVRLDQLEKIAAPLLDRGLCVSVAAEWDYPAHEAIVRRAVATRADLIVAHHHPGKHHGTWPLSLTDWELLRLSPVPVLLVKSPQPYRHPVVLAAIDPLHAFATPARLDSRILGLGALMAKGLHGKLHAVHAHMKIPVGAGPAVVTDARVGTELRREIAAIAGAAFERALRSTIIPPRRRHLVGGDPASVIRNVSRKIGSDIVVLGALSRSGIKRAFIGDTAEHVIDELRSDLLVVKPANFTSRFPQAQRGVRVVPAPAPMP